MTGGVIQLVTVGIQDMYLTGDPHITFFKIVYRRHTNFAIESKQQYFSQTPDFGQYVTSVIDKQGDLLSKMVLFVELPSIPKFYTKDSGEENLNMKFAWVQNLGFSLITEISVEINSYKIDKQYGEFMYIWSEVSDKKKKGLNKMIGNIPQLYEFSNGKPSYQLYIPLNFWFCKNIGSALPLISTGSSEIKIGVKFREFEHCCRIGPTNSVQIVENVSPIKPGDYIYQKVNNETVQGYVTNFDYLTKKLYYIKIVSPSANVKQFQSYTDNVNEFTILKTKNAVSDKLNVPYRIYNTVTGSFVTPKPNTKEMTENTNIPQPRFVNCYFFTDVVYLNNEERLKFLSCNHSYLIEQVQLNQETGIKNRNSKINLILNHSCKSIYWVARLDAFNPPDGKGINQLYNYTTSPVMYQDDTTMKTEYYGSSLIKHSSLLLNEKSRFKEGDTTMTNYLQPYQHHSRGPDVGINMYSFAIYPENIQPSSTVNMSKINKISLNLVLSNKVNNQNSAKVTVYTINYNILRIYPGVISLAFDFDSDSDSDSEKENITK